MDATLEHEKPLSLVVVGASGDLARKKVIPALFSLYCQGHLPRNFNLFGFARQAMTHEEFRARVMENLTCRYTPDENHCARYMDEFLSRCYYVAGQYADRDSFLGLYAEMRARENGNGEANRLYYMAIPPFLFMDVAHALAAAGLVSCGDSVPGWSRAVIEKPFGRDRDSSDQLVADMGKVFTEDQTYRIDHYLGKEVIQNLLVLRFANLVLDPVWNRSCIQSVRIAWKEPIGLEGRGGYFDDYGIVRDVMQNHLLQILALLAMEQPVRLDAHSIRDEKVKVLRAIPPIRPSDIVIGQYARAEDGSHPAYREEGGVPADSRTPTYAAAALQIRNRRWDGVPFFIECGKALDERVTEIRLKFRPVPGNIFQDILDPLPANDLVIRVQPNESITLNLVNKKPGLALNLVESALNLRYDSAFQAEIPDAYECLLLDVIRGDKSLFIRADELAAAWDVFTPALHQFENEKVEPILYPFGGTGPNEARSLALRLSV